MASSNDCEVWAYDEPHESGGNCHVTMTRRLAIDYMRRLHPELNAPDETVFWDWATVNWAYREDTPPK